MLRDEDGREYVSKHHLSGLELGQVDTTTLGSSWSFGIV